MDLLGGVDQQEEQGESPRDLTGYIQRKGVDSGQQLFERRGIVLAAPSGSTCDPQRLHGIEDFRPFQSANGLS